MKERENMSEQILKKDSNLKKGGTEDKRKIQTLAKIAMLAAVAAILMLFEIPLPFLAPTFYEIDFSEVPVLIGSFAMGPLAGIAIEAVKILLNFVITGTDTAGVGELANFLLGCSFLLPASLIYCHKKTKKTAMAGLVAGTVTMAVAACFMNAFVLLPAYAAAFGMPVEAFIQMGTAINSHINNLFTFAVLAVAPFNLVKGVAVSLIVMVLYKRISILLKGRM